MKSFIFVFLLFAAFVAKSTQMLNDGLRIDWTNDVPNAVSYSLWKMTPPSTNWQWMLNTTNYSVVLTNRFPVGTMFGLTAVVKTSDGLYKDSDMGVASWPPDIGTTNKFVRLTPASGVEVETNQLVKISSDLKVFDDWLTFSVTTNGKVRITHSTSAAKPHFFVAYPSPVTAPSPATGSVAPSPVRK